MKKHVALFLCALLFVIGLSAGFVLGSLKSGHFPAQSSTFLPDSSQQHSDSSNAALLEEAAEVVSELQGGSFSAFTSHIDPENGITFTPVSTVDFNTDLHFTAAELRSASADGTSFIWGVSPGHNEPIRMNVQDYFRTYVWDTDYTNGAQIGICQVLHRGNAAENVENAYEGCRYLDFYLSGSDEQDWSSLKLVFRSVDGRWYLTGIVHSSWTP